MRVTGERETFDPRCSKVDEPTAGEEEFDLLQILHQGNGLRHGLAVEGAKEAYVKLETVFPWQVERVSYSYVQLVF